MTKGLWRLKVYAFEVLTRQVRGVRSYVKQSLAGDHSVLINHDNSKLSKQKLDSEFGTRYYHFKSVYRQQLGPSCSLCRMRKVGLSGTAYVLVSHLICPPYLCTCNNPSPLMSAPC